MRYAFLKGLLARVSKGLPCHKVPAARSNNVASAVAKAMAGQGATLSTIRPAPSGTAARRAGKESNPVKVGQTKSRFIVDGHLGPEGRKVRWIRRRWLQVKLLRPGTAALRGGSNRVKSAFAALWRDKPGQSTGV